MATCPSCRDHYADDVTNCTKDGSTLVPDAVMAAADSELKAGDQVGEYRIDAKVGEGGFGAVYRAVHPVIGKTAAVKLLHRQFSSSPQMVSRFIAEAKAVNQIRHKNIIDIFSFGALPDGRQYYVMELLEGMSFDHFIRQRGRLPIEEALPILRGIGRALDAAHAAGIVHRDLKPENIFVLFDEDGVPTPKLLDFGIAKLLGDSEQSHKTRTGTPMGTPYFMSPEQSRGKSVDHRTDIYSFGVMTHQALTGRVVFDGESVMDVLFKHVNAPPPRMSETCPDLPAALDGPVLQMLAKDPADRPATVMEAVDALARAANEAGFNVPAPARPGGNGNIPAARASDRGAVLRASNSTPSSNDALASAQTVVVGVDPTLIAASGSAPPSRNKRTLVLAAGAIAVVLAAVLFGFATNDPARKPASAKIAVAAPASAPVTAAIVPSVTPSGMPSTTATVSPAAEPIDVEIQIQSTPQIVDIYRGSEKIGSSAAPIKLKHGEKVKLTFKAPGFIAQDLEVSPAQNTLLPVKLLKAQTGRTSSEVQW